MLKTSLALLFPLEDLQTHERSPDISVLFHGSEG